MESPTSYKDITTYNNFYEFGTDKADPAKYAGSLITGRGLWRLKVWSKNRKYMTSTSC